MSALDPFYLVKEEIQDSVKGLQATFTQWERLPPSATDRIVLSKELLSGCESIEWQVEELDRATGVAERDPARFSIDLVEIERRKKWIASTFSQVHSIRRKLQTAAENGSGIRPGIATSNRRELMRMDEHPLPKSNHTADNGFVTDESGRQALIMK
jgi:SYP6 family syntaxin